jgi:CTP:molybdopterin cytidylyltransferase MocA
VKPDRFHIGAIVLAAGASSRMGEPKQLLPLGGRPLVVRTVDALLASTVWPVVVVVGAHHDRVRPLLARHPVLISENAAWSEGLASSIRAGIGTLQEFSRDLDAALVTLCDQPAFSAEIVARLIATMNDSGRSIVAARYGGRWGVPALFRREHFGTLAALTGEAGARDFLNRDPDGVTGVELPELAIDVDTPGDYQAALRREAGR